MERGRQTKLDWGDVTELEPPTRGDYRRIWALALVSVVVLTSVEVLRVFVPPAISPRVNIRWAEGVDDAARVNFERLLKLSAGEWREGTTWMYDLGDPTPSGVRELIAHPSVEDTFHIDRRLDIVSRDAPRGTTRIADGHLSMWRDSPLFNWLTRLSLSVLAISALWLATTGRAARESATPPH